MKRILFVSLLVSILFSCTKKPEAKFHYNQYAGDIASYTEGDMVRLTNTSKDAVRYEWKLPDGRTVTDKDVEFSTSSMSGSYYSVKLTAFSKNGKHYNTYEEGFEVSKQVGRITFWKSSSCGCGAITVYKGLTTGYLTSDFTSAPPAYTSGAQTFVDYGGVYTYTATDGVKNWNGSYTITNNCDLKIQLN